MKKLGCDNEVSILYFKLHPNVYGVLLQPYYEQNTNWFPIWPLFHTRYHHVPNTLLSSLILKSPHLNDIIFAEKRSKSPPKVDEDGIITEKDEEKKPRKPDDYYTLLLGPACETDLFKRTSELDLIRRAAENDKTKTTKGPDPMNCTPTRRAMLQIAVLKPGDLFVSAHHILLPWHCISRIILVKRVSRPSIT